MCLLHNVPTNTKLQWLLGRCGLAQKHMNKTCQRNPEHSKAHSQHHISCRFCVFKDKVVSLWLMISKIEDSLCKCSQKCALFLMHFKTQHIINHPKILIPSFTNPHFIPNSIFSVFEGLKKSEFTISRMKVQEDHKSEQNVKVTALHFSQYSYLYSNTNIYIRTIKLKIWSLVF